jgi:hypothetical protein
MFRIELFVEDKRLADTLRAVAGKTRGAPNVQPVVNAAPNGKAETDGGLVGMFAAFLRKANIIELPPAHIGRWLEDHGFSKNTSSYLARRAVEAGILKKVGSSSATRYRVKNRAEA